MTRLLATFAALALLAGPAHAAIIYPPDQDARAWIDSVLEGSPYDWSVLEVEIVVGDGSHYLPGVVTIARDVVGHHKGSRVLLHELGHAVDDQTLTDADRDELRAAWGTEQAWTADVPHEQQVSEAFASYFVHVAGSKWYYPWGENAHLREEGLPAAREVTMRAMHRALGSPEPDPELPETGAEAAYAPFPDVAGHRHADAIQWAMGEGIVVGHEDGLFRPDAPVTRAQMVAMLRRMEDSRE